MDHASDVFSLPPASKVIPAEFLNLDMDELTDKFAKEVRASTEKQQQLHAGESTFDEAARNISMVLLQPREAPVGLLRVRRQGWEAM